MNDQEKLMSVFALAYLLIAKLMKLTPSKEGFQQILLMLGEDGIQACAEVADQGPEAVALTMVEVILTKQTLKAAKGAKLNRIMALNNACPEGYMKKGGKCKKCEKGDKFSRGIFGNAGVTQYFKDGDIIKYQNGTMEGVVRTFAPKGSTVTRGKTSKGAPATVVTTGYRDANGNWVEKKTITPDKLTPNTGDAAMASLAGAGMFGATNNLLKSTNLAKYYGKYTPYVRGAASALMGSVAAYGDYKNNP